MISRTTTIGMMMGLAYIIYSTGIFRLTISVRNFKFYSVFGFLLVVSVIWGIYMYQNNYTFYQNMRFAFEGFFNWIEMGEWRTGSTDRLNAIMWVWPETFESWIIGTGKFGFYTFSTDIGYCRFILYCGLVGFGVFVIVLYIQCMGLCPEKRVLSPFIRSAAVSGFYHLDKGSY